LPALEVSADDVVAAVPLFAVRTTVRMTERDLAESAGRSSIIYEGQAIPFLRLREILPKAYVRVSGGHNHDVPGNAGTRQAWSAIILEHNSRIAAIGVDRLLGATTAVVEQLPALTAAEGFVSGISRNSCGDLQLLLDPQALIARAGMEKPLQLRTTPRRLSVLVTDDSLTTRMLEQSILESAGYDVDLAISAEQGLEKAEAKSYDIFLVDVEMPGMNGFEFIARTQADPRLSNVPAILVTSCNSPDDRRRAEEVGARGYVVKGEFDQTHLLRLIRELAGE
jgi:two-component system chemotaxis sensor kinase CheA